MTDGLDEFLAPLARRTVEVVGANWLPPTVGKWLQLVVMPSFRADLVITVTDDGSACRLLAHSAQCNVHSRDAYSTGQPEVPRPAGAERLLEPPLAEQIWHAARAVQGDRDEGGLDGTLLVVRHRLGDELVEFDSWSPRPTAEVRPLIDLLLAACRESAAAPLDAVVADVIASIATGRQ